MKELKIFVGHMSIVVALFCTSADVSSGFQSQSGFSRLRASLSVRINHAFET